jgi:hypothetical protein
LEDLSRDEFPSVVHGWVDDALRLDDDGTHFLFVVNRPAELSCASGTFALSPGMYAAVPGALRVALGTGIIITRVGYRGFFHLGGPVEQTGRLRYIDGCSDSLLIPPVVQGDPCVNLLHLPPGVRQTEHTHPSFRVGLVICGAGLCIVPSGRVALTPGAVFVIQAHGRHCFHTDDQPLLVLAYHPDSDFGPTHADHPMINRTVLKKE